MLEQPDSPSSSVTQSIQPENCSICSERVAKYTCPRCSTKTCCVQCSAAHKKQQSCSGVRNKAAYVPMNKFGYGALMSDYVFLEEVGRQVGEWGREAVRGGYLNTQQQQSGRGGRGRGRGYHATSMRSSAHGGGGKRTKREILKMQLDIRDIDMALLPVGMDKRQLNRSQWDFRNKRALLTIKFIIHPPPDPLRPSHISPIQPTTLLTHHNDFEIPLLSLLQKQISDRSRSKKEGELPTWLTNLILPGDLDSPESFMPPRCYMLASPDPARKHPAYHALDCSQKLYVLLRHKEFVEFPTIEVWEEGSFSGIVVDNRGSIIQDPDRDQDGGQQRKRRKLDVRQGKAAIEALLGAYGSDEADSEEIEAKPNALVTLDNYTDSDIEQEHQSDDRIVDTKGWEDDEDEEPLDEDPASLLETLKKIGSLPDGVYDEDGVVDWGDSD